MFIRVGFLLFVWCALPVVALAQVPKKPDYPASKTVDVVDRHHGVEVPDPYRWLEDGNGDDVKAWTAKQNEFTRSILDRAPQREAIRKRLDQLLDAGTITVVVPRKGRYFYTRRDGKQNQPAVMMVNTNVKGEAVEETVIDPNSMSKDGTIAMDWWFPSSDGLLIAYGTSRNGDEISTLRIRDVTSGKDLGDTIEFTRACSVAWLPDGKGFYYTRYPKPGSVPVGEEKYHRHVFFHRLGDDPEKDVEEFGKGRHATDWPEVQLSPNGRWLVVTVRKGWAKSEVYLRDRETANSKFIPIVENVEANFVAVLRNDRIYLRTNNQAPRFQLLAVDPLKPGTKDWKVVIPEGKDVLELTAPIGDHIAALYLRNASSQLVIVDSDGKTTREVPLPTLGTITGLGGEWDGHELFFAFQSFATPPRVFHFDLRPRGGKATPPQLWKGASTDVDATQYDIKQVRYPSKDGTEITMFLVAKKGLVQNGKTPTLLYGYGGFTLKQTPMFHPSRFVFLEKGGLLAVTNLRGGGEYGEAWHQAGMLEKKQNVFDDFIAAAEYLIREKYTDKDHLAIMGGSNGGLLVGAATTQRPELFRAVVCQVPLLDMVRYHRFLIAKLWIPEYGSSEDVNEFRYLHAYSPYHRIKEGTAYPAMLLTAAESDTRVDPLHARKMAARLQANSSSHRPILLRVETKAGHGAGKPRAKVLEEQTDVWSFLFAELGMK